MNYALPWLLTFVLAGALHATVTFWEELSYFSPQDSPFYEGIQAGTIFLEDFEDHELNTPHVVSWDFPNTLQLGHTHRFAGAGNPITTFSVDSDDGLNGDFLGRNGDTWATSNASNGGSLGYMQLRFTPDILGRHPTFVGFVITEAFDFDDEIEFSVGTLTGPESTENIYDPLSWIPRLDSFPGDTRTHRFFGVYAESGIHRLDIENVRQIDHLQYGYAIPEPGVPILVLLSLVALNRRVRST